MYDRRYFKWDVIIIRQILLLAILRLTPSLFWQGFFICFITVLTIYWMGEYSTLCSSRNCQYQDQKCLFTIPLIRNRLYWKFDQLAKELWLGIYVSIRISFANNSPRRLGASQESRPIVPIFSIANSHKACASASKKKQSSISVPNQRKIYILILRRTRKKQLF